MARPKIHPHTYNCVECNKESIYRVSKNNLYCSITCQATSQYKKYVDDWKNGIISGAGVNGPSKHIKRYLLDKYKNSCYTCGIDSWNNKTITLEIEHIDGDSTNNTEDNLAVICPNCHSQTATYKGANKGSGRHSRRVRYAEGKSY
jgi:hypothetical protein